MRAPLHPIGWPRAIAPPLTLSRSGSKPSSRSTASTWAANASLSSIRSMSSSETRVLSSRLRTAGTGPMPMISGCTPSTRELTHRAIGSTPSLSAVSPARTSIEAAPSVIPLEFPAVTDPLSGSKTGLSSANPSVVTPARGCSSRSIVSVPFRVSISTGATSRSKRPSRHAASARCWVRAA